MVYEVIKELGEHKIGSIVSDDYGETVLKMYSTPHVKKIIEETKPEQVIVKEETKQSDLNKDGIVDKKDAVIASKVLNDVKKQDTIKKGRR
jgi:hypothetical protein